MMELLIMKPRAPPRSRLPVGVRTGFGALRRLFEDLSAIDWALAAARSTIQRSGVPAGDFGHTVFGNAL